jgi:Xaa-Pro aminopeptidase
MTSDLGARWRNLQARAADEGLAAIYVTAGPNFRWLTDFTAHPGGWPIWLSAVLIPASAPPALVISRMHADIFDISTWESARVFTYVDGEDPSSALQAAFASLKTAKDVVGVEDSLWFGDAELLRANFPAMRLGRGQSILDDLRSVKDAYEIQQLRIAAGAHDAGYQAAATNIRAGASLAEAAGAILSAMNRAGSEETQMAGSFTRIRERRFQSGEIVDVDLWPGSCGGYHADTARNVFIGDPSPEIHRVYDVIQRAYDAALKATRSGVPAEAVNAAAVGVITENGLSQVWKIGHGVGLADQHEAPLLQAGNKVPLKSGMVVTIDPGVFVARNTPVHIEDTVLVTDDGCEPLNAFPHKMIVT